MKNKMKRIVSMVLMLLLCIGFLPMLSIEAEAEGYYSESELSNVKCTIISNPARAEYINTMMKYHIQSSTDNYRIAANNLEQGRSVVFFFDGCSDNVDSATYGDYTKYHLSAYCAVVQKVNGVLTVVYESENCSTIPDNPRNVSLNEGTAVPTVLDGVYNIVSTNHNGRYAALHIQDNGGSVPAIRCTSSTSYISTSNAINIHARSSFSNTPQNGVSSSSYSSTGCFNVGLIDNTWSEYNKFINSLFGISNAIITTPYSGGSWTKCTSGIDKGVVIVDRSQYKTQLAAIYGGDNSHSASALVSKITAYTDGLDISVESDNTVLSSYNIVLPLKAYLMGTSTVYPYSNSQMTVSNGGEIWSTDECTITEVYSNGACKVTYPVGSSTRTAFISMSYFMVNTTSAWKKQTVDRQITTYIRPGGAEYGYIDTGDEIYTIGTSGSMTQIFYPVDAQYGGGYKLAWVETSLLNTAHTCNRNEFVFFEEAHPHYNCYRCTVCGEIYRDVTTAYSSSCRECNIPGKPALKDMKISYLDSETVKFIWDATEHTTHYNIWLDKKNAQGEWEKYDQIAYVTSGKEVSLGLGEYRACVQSYNSEFWLEDGSDWLYTEGDFVYFAVVKSQYTVNYNVNGGTGTINSQTKTYGKPLTLSTVVPTKENDIFMGWATEDNPTVVQYQPGDTYAADSDVTLVAVWKQNLNPTIFVDSVSAKPGETVAIPVCIAENPGIVAARLKLSYETSVLKLVLVSDGNILGEHQFGEDLTVSPYIVSWSNGGATEDYTTNGALVYLIFQIANDAPAGDVTITVIYDPEEIYNKDGTKVAFAVQQGSVTVEGVQTDAPQSTEEKPTGFFAAIAAFFEALFRILFFFLYL